MHDNSYHRDVRGRNEHHWLSLKHQMLHEKAGNSTRNLLHLVRRGEKNTTVINKTLCVPVCFFLIVVIRLLKTDALSDGEQMIQLSPGDSAS